MDEGKEEPSKEGKEQFLPEKGKGFIRKSPRGASFVVKKCGSQGRLLMSREGKGETRGGGGDTTTK